MLHVILTMHIFNVDEFASLSAQEVSSIDITMRILRKSHIPFGGLFLIGTMDHLQIQPINQLPFLTSSLVLTYFEEIELKNSVRAHGDLDYQCLQDITRMNPFQLRNDGVVKNNFFELAGRILTFVPDWNDSRIMPNMIRCFSRKKPAQNALNEYRESVIFLLSNESIDYRLAVSRDLQQTCGTNGEYSPATPQSVWYLNKEMREPTEIVLFSGGVYECTINDTRGCYNQSQLAFLLELPAQDSIDRFDGIPLWISPPGTQLIDFHKDNIPSKEQLRTLGWEEVIIGVTPERLVKIRGRLQAKRLQYLLKHIGAITINKSQGETLASGLAVEITKDFSPWEKRTYCCVLKSYSDC